jgi:hypothetical protein
MGRQTGFYAIGSDLALLAQAFKAKGALILAYRSVGPEATARGYPRAADTMEILVREQDLPQVRREDTNGHGWVVDQRDPPVVEYSHGALYEGTLQRGRLWFSARDLSGTPKSEDFVKWASSLLRTVGTTLRLRRHHGGYVGYYVGPEAFGEVVAGRLVLEWKPDGSFDEEEIAEWKNLREGGGGTLGRVKRSSKEG